MGSYLLWGLLLLLGLLLFSPVALEGVWRKEILTLRVRVLGVFRITLCPRRQKPQDPQKEAKAKAAKEAKAAKKAKKAKKKGKTAKTEPAVPKDPATKVLDTLQTVNDLLPHLAYSCGYLMKRLTLSRCRIAMIVAEEEAADTALAYGKANAVGYSVYSALCGFIRVKEFTFNVFPDFISQTPAADVELTLWLRPSTLLAAGGVLLYRWVRQQARPKG